MSIKKQIRKIGESVTVNYNSTDKIFTVSTSTTKTENSSLKKALRAIKSLPKSVVKAPKLSAKKKTKKS